MTTKTARTTPGRSTKAATGRRRASAAGGRKGANAAPPGGEAETAKSPPTCPYQLRTFGEAWWRWAWATPQSKQWDDGALYAVARRAALEDDLEALEGDDISVADVLDLQDEHAMARELDWLIGRLRSMVGGRSAVMREMRELDARLGLDPKAMKGLGWKADDGKKDRLDELAERRSKPTPRRARPARPSST